MLELHNAKCNKFLAQNVLTFLREMLKTLKQNVTNKAVKKKKTCQAWACKPPF